MEKNVKLLTCAIGIFVCYFFYGILQEKITRGSYGDENERFTYTLSLVFVQCIVNYIYALLTFRLTFTKTGEDSTKSSYYAFCALTYLIAMVTSTKALQWVNYPTQVVGKSCKPIPVMILGVLVGRKVYSPQKYLFILMIVLGVSLFMYKDNDSSQSTSGILGFGEILLLISLTCDGLTGAIQERMKSEHNTKSGSMMKNINLWSICFLSLALVLSGEIWDFFLFVNRHPSVLLQIGGFSIMSALGQFFIFMCVSEFGPLSCSIMTTTRKFFTVLVSVVFFGNSLKDRQWIGTFFVFTGLILDGIYGK